MRIFMTGSTGFIGKHIIDELLSRNHTVLALVRKKGSLDSSNQLQEIIGDLENIDLVKSNIIDFAPECILHFAWEGIPDYDYENSLKNLQYGLNILKICEQCNCKMLMMAGSCWEYEAPIGAVKESDSISSDNGFKASKNALRLMSEAFCKERGIQLYWPRLFYVYGPGQKQTSLLPHIIQSLKQKRTPSLKEPYNKNDFIYVKDVASAVMKIIEKRPESVVFNVGSGKGIQVIDAMQIASKLVDDSVIIEATTSFTMGTCHFWADIDRLTEQTGWVPEYSLEDGIKDMLANETWELL